MSLPTSPLRLLPTAATFVGWDFHPLEFRAFSRRTELVRLEKRDRPKAVNPKSETVPVSPYRQ